MKNQKIKCNVNSCDFNDINCDECTLKQIKVSCSCNNHNVHEKSETICSSFKNSKEKE